MPGSAGGSSGMSPIVALAGALALGLGGASVGVRTVVGFSPTATASWTPIFPFASPVSTEEKLAEIAKVVGQVFSCRGA